MKDRPTQSPEDIHRVMHELGSLHVQGSIKFAEVVRPASVLAIAAAAEFNAAVWRRIIRDVGIEKDVIKGLQAHASACAVETYAALKKDMRKMEPELFAESDKDRATVANHLATEALSRIVAQHKAEKAEGK